MAARSTSPNLRYTGRELYLVAFNVISLISWIHVLFKSYFYVRQNNGLLNIYLGFCTDYLTAVYSSVVFAQSLAILEVLHSLVGLVKSPVVTTVIQVFSRLHILYLLFPACPASSYVDIYILLMVVPWSLAEISRYPYYIMKLLNKGEEVQSKYLFILTYVRYSAFLLLYPSGILGEMLCMITGITVFHSGNGNIYFPVKMPNAINFHINLFYFYCSMIFALVPGGIHMYMYMLFQRKRVLYGDLSKSEKKLA